MVGKAFRLSAACAAGFLVCLANAAPTGTPVSIFKTNPPASGGQPTGFAKPAGSTGLAGSTGNVVAGVMGAKHGRKMTIRKKDAFSLSELEAAKARAKAERKPLGFVMIWDQFFNVASDSRQGGSGNGLAHFYDAFRKNLVLVFVSHETELDKVPEAVKLGFFGPDEGGAAPNMAVTDATATEFIVEIPLGGGQSPIDVRTPVFAKGAETIDAWLKTHPAALPLPTPTPTPGPTETPGGG